MKPSGARSPIRVGAKDQPRAANRASDVLTPLTFKTFLLANDAQYAGLSEKLQNAAATVLYAGLTRQRTHKLLFHPDDLFPIFHQERRRLFGSAATFAQVNGLLRWFALKVHAKKGLYARGYKLTKRARLLGCSYLEQSLSHAAPAGDLTSISGQQYRFPARAVRSTTQTGGNSQRFRDVQLSSRLTIDVNAIKRLIEAAQAWLRKEDAPEGSGRTFEAWTMLRADPGKKGLDVHVTRRVRRARVQALALLDLAKRATPSGCVIPSTYVEAAQGRLYGEGALHLQGCLREVRHAALSEHFEVDVENCHWVLLQQMASQHGVTTPTIQRYLETKKQVRAQLANDCMMSVDDAKFVLLATVYGARLGHSTKYSRSSIEQRIGGLSTLNVINHPLVLGLSKEVRKARRALLTAAAAESPKPGFIVNAAGRQLTIKSSKPNQQLSHLLQGAESEILRVCLESCGGDIVLIQHDGFTSKRSIDTLWLSAIVKERTGYHITFECGKF